MEEKKHIDRLYQEKFKDFEATPREAVWKNISTRLQQKDRNRKIIPLWYRIAGVAAVFALFFNFAIDLFKTPGSIPATAATTINKEGPKDLSIASASYNQNMFRSSLVLSALIQETKNLKAKEEALSAQNTENKIRNVSFVNIIKAPELIGSDNDAYTFSDYNSIALQNAEPREEEQPQDIELKPDFPAITLANEDVEDDVAVKNISKRMSVSTTAAPIMYDRPGSGSAIDAQFANNRSSSDVTMAYGVNFAYQISERIKVRSGISKVDFSYNTNDIAFTAAVNPVALSGVDYQGEVPNYRIENRSVRQFSNISASSEFNRASLASPTSGFINQRLGFIEVPLEIEYIIVDKKIGFNIIGGASTMFLDENMVSLNSSNFSTNLGEANNINNVSFTTNVGLGLDYNFSSQFQLNLEPIFKYQINAFNNSSGDMNPYYFGIYSGFSFKF